MAAEANQVVIAPHSALPAPPSETAAILHMIERAARDPSVDIDKMQRLLDLRRQIKAEQAESEFDAALSAAQADMRPVATDSNNPQTKSKYASYVALDAALRPIYTKHGFGLSFDQGDGAPPEYVRVLCRVSHAGGHRRTHHIDMPADGKGAKGGDVMTKTHAAGSAVTYGRRYLLLMIFNIAVGQDDDGNAAGSGSISAEQLSAMQSKIVELGAEIPKVCQFAKVERLEHIAAKQFPRIMAALDDWAKKQGATR